MLMGSERDLDLDNLNRGRIASSALDLVDELLDDIEDEADTRALTLVAKNALTSDMAMAGWYEKLAIRKLRARLKAVEMAGRRAAHRLAPEMGTIGGTDGTDE